MNTRINKIVLFSGFAALAFSMTLGTSPVSAGQKTVKKPVKITSDQFQLTLSTVPYSKSPDAAFVRNTCAPGKKKKKPNS